MSNSFQSLKVLFTRCEVTKLKRKLSGLYIIYSGQLQGVTYYMSSYYLYSRQMLIVTLSEFEISMILVETEI